MGSSQQVPTIDFTKGKLKPGSEEWVTMRDKVYRALEEYGCFEALLDGTPKERLYEKLKQAFNLPLESIFENSLALSGYTKGNPKLAIQERLVISHPHTPGVIDTFSKKLWPNGDLEFCDMVQSYVKRLNELDEMVRRMVFEKLGIVENYWEEQKKSTSSIVAFFKYKVSSSETNNVGLPPHTDKHITTILSQHSQHVNGLQLRNKDGHWFDFQYSSPHSFLFLVNDCLMALTNGRIHSPYHRVTMGKEERYSIGLFTIGKEGYIIKAAEKLVDEEHPLLYKPFEAVKYFEFSISDKGGGPLETYCGVSTT